MTNRANTDHLDSLIEELTVDACDDDEQISGFLDGADEALRSGETARLVLRAVPDQLCSDQASDRETLPRLTELRVGRQLSGEETLGGGENAAIVSSSTHDGSRLINAQLAGENCL